MNDRELLELAAKAIDKSNWQSTVCYIGGCGCDSELRVLLRYWSKSYREEQNGE
jgi:hypothetical protein